VSRVVARASVAYLLRHGWQLALSITGIAIGVAVIVAVDIANSSARVAFTLSMDTIAGDVTHQIVGGPSGIDSELYRRLRVDEGIDSIAPVIEGPAIAAGREVSVLGVDPFAEESLRDYTGEAAEGDALVSLLTDAGAVAMSARTASQLGIGIGDGFDVDVYGDVRDATLVGVFGDGEAGPLDDLIVTDISTAALWFDTAGRLSRIDARLVNDTAINALRAVLPPGITLLDAAGRTRTTLDLSAAFMTNLKAMSLLALLVGVFLIYNSQSFSVLQRRGLIGTLRALGVSRTQIFTTILGEAAVLGTLSAALGLALGVLLGEQLLSLVTRSINDLYFRVTVTELAIPPWTLAKGAAAGILTSLVAAAVPAIEASSYAPRLSMQRSSLEQRAGRWLPRIFAVGVAIMLAAAIVLAFSGRHLTAGLVAVFMLIAGFALCIPIGVRYASIPLADMAGRVGGLPARLAVAGIRASLSRTGVAIVALAVAVSATIGVSVMVDSFRQSVSDWLGQALQADAYVSADSGGVPADDIDAILALPAVETVTTSRRARIEDEQGVIQVLAVDMHEAAYAGTDIIRGDADDAWHRWEQDNVVYISEPFSYKQRMDVGDTLTLRTDAGETGFEIAAVYQSYDVGASGVMMSRRIYDRHFDDSRVDALGLYLGADADVDAVLAEIDALSDGKLITTSNRAIRARSLEVFDQTFVITDVLYWLATGVAFVGILSSMLALQLEKGREQGTLRAIGMTPLQLGRLIGLQTSTIGLFSGIAAVPLGLAMAWILIEVINRRAFGWQIDVAVSLPLLAEAIVFSIVAALLAGLYPAWRASRIRPAVAMREE